MNGSENESKTRMFNLYCFIFCIKKAISSNEKPPTNNEKHCELFARTKFNYMRIMQR